jgi:hypothetical protein
MWYLILAVIAYLLFAKSGVSISSILSSGSAGFGINQNPPLNPPPPAQYVQGTGDISAAQQNQFAVVQANNAALNAVPIVGPALSAIASAVTSSLEAASRKRAKEATNENTAVAAAVPGWDQAVYQVAQLYNQGSLTAQAAIQMVDDAWNNYWFEVGPKIQPGRNGCQGGSMTKQQADTQFPGMKQCSGSWGAACCVGYADLANGAQSIKSAITQTEKDGSTVNAYIPAVYASKYGGTNRAAYTLPFTRSSGAFHL